MAPSLIATEMIKPHRLDHVARTPARRQGTVDEIAAVVLMAVGNAHLTGQTSRSTAAFVQLTPTAQPPRRAGRAGMTHILCSQILLCSGDGSGTPGSAE